MMKDASGFKTGRLALSIALMLALFAKVAPAQVSFAFNRGNLGARSYSAIELGILKDLGYTLVVPEPGATAVVMLTVSVLVVALRRSRIARLKAT